MSTDPTMSSDSNPEKQRVAGSRRGTIAALLAGSALGLAAMSGPSPVQAAKGKKSKKNKGGNGGNNVGGSLPSVRYVYKTTTFDNNGVVTASATCPDGFLPIGAGLTNSISDPVILSSLPQLESNSWEFELDGAQTGHQATVIAVCLAASDDTTVEDTEHRSTRRKRGKRGHKK